ncbi:FimB/Mfa2 family fimbrial subunit [Prevotella sp. HUN102]|uniref:FimB/Mfa2 family fimbrial subunit n=1 Tax=Prevotella sp. HUN102 TaxID=1392486 RepID=UPI0004921CFE|nr:FimB/Mfa2 family fimbrial subunit [Prevotella sp. HUN102]
MKHFNKILLAIFTLATIIGCDSLIYDDNKDCPQGVYVSFYSQTPCEEEPVYPSVEHLEVFAFDENGILAGMQEVENPKLAADYEIYMPLPQGAYTFVAWTGLDADRLERSLLKVGSTKKSDLLFSLKEKAVFADANPEPGFKIYQGESEKIYLPSSEDNGTVEIHTKVNLMEQTNRIKVSLVGVKEPNNFEIRVYSANGSSNVDGNMPLNNKVMQYPGIATANPSDTVLVSKFNTLKLKTGYKNTLEVYDKFQNKVIFRADLIGSILLSKSDDHDTNINLDCTHDFDVKLYVRDVCNCDDYTVIACEVNLIKWSVHSYSIDLGGVY